MRAAPTNRSTDVFFNLIFCDESFLPNNRYKSVYDTK